MNTKLVESLVQVIQSLTLEEKALLEEKLKPRSNWEVQKKKLQEIHAQIAARRGEESLDLGLADYIQQGRDERTAQQDELVRETFGKPK
ncbi:MAG: hypothetical protein HC899_31535 [Leptolyngbyaceae cyanobacterium SM1_4_3]|nr:hypothetical protein [Leptolyngbyaceae cyanobacterium SM1_4_3]